MCFGIFPYVCYILAHLRLIHFIYPYEGHPDVSSILADAAAEEEDHQSTQLRPAGHMRTESPETGPKTKHA